MADNVLDDAAPAPTDLPDDSEPPAESAASAPESDAPAQDPAAPPRKDRSRLYVIVGAIVVLVAVIGGVALSKFTGSKPVTIEHALAALPGKQAPPMNAVPGDAKVGSKPFDLKGYLAQERTPVLVVFFANWNNRSQAAMPDLKRVTDEAQGRYRVLAEATLVNSEPAKAGWETPQAALATAGVAAPLVRDDSQADFANWYISDLPQAFVIDPHGTVRLAKTGKHAITEAEKYLSEHTG